MCLQHGLEVSIAEAEGAAKLTKGQSLRSEKIEYKPNGILTTFATAHCFALFMPMLQPNLAYKTLTIPRAALFFVLS